MSDKQQQTGSCLCGAVTFSTESVNNSVGSCHCTMCRKWGGGPFMAIDCGTNVLFEGQHNISVYDSTELTERGFCNNCGSHLFFRIKQSQQHMIPAGLFDNNDAFVFDHQVFIDYKPSYYSFSNETKQETEAEVFARNSQD